MSTLTIFTLSARSPTAISLSIVSIFRHGWHHSAQKSTKTGISDLRTSASKVLSLTGWMAPIRTPSTCFLKLQRRDVALGVQGSRATGAGGGDRLPIGVVDEIAGGEHALDVG